MEFKKRSASWTRKNISPSDITLRPLEKEAYLKDGAIDFKGPKKEMIDATKYGNKVIKQYAIESINKLLDGSLNLITTAKRSKKVLAIKGNKFDKKCF